MKCDICSSKIELTFMSKIIGSYYMKGKKKKVVCNNCQRNLKDSEIREKLNI